MGWPRFMRPSSPRAGLARELVASLGDRLPVSLRDQFASAAAFDAGEVPERWARRVGGLVALVDEPERVLEALDKAEPRQV